MNAEQERRLMAMLRDLMCSKMIMLDVSKRACVMQNNKRLPGKGYTAPP